MGRVTIGMDSHKRSATIEVINEREKVLARGRYGTDTDGYRAMLAAGRQYPDRVWAVEGCSGIGRHIAQRLVADGETVIDVPAKLSARVRVFDTGQGRKTDPVDAHSVAVAGLRSPGLRRVAADDVTVALRLLIDRREELGRARTEVVSRIHHLLLEIVPGGAKKFLTRGQASYLLRTAPEPVGIAAQTRHQLARELIEELTDIDLKIRRSTNTRIDPTVRGRPAWAARCGRGGRRPGRDTNATPSPGELRAGSDAAQGGQAMQQRGQQRPIGRCEPDSRPFSCRCRRAS